MKLFLCPDTKSIDSEHTATVSYGTSVRVASTWCVIRAEKSCHSGRKLSVTVTHAHGNASIAPTAFRIFIWSYDTVGNVKNDDKLVTISEKSSV